MSLRGFELLTFLFALGLSCMQWVLDFLAEERGISTIKGELIPLLVSSQGFV
jgi:hypothetical protein